MAKALGTSGRVSNVTSELREMVGDIMANRKTAAGMDQVPPPPGAYVPAQAMAAQAPAAGHEAGGGKRGGQSEMTHEIKSMRAELFQMRKMLVGLFKALNMPVPDDVVLGEHPARAEAAGAPAEAARAPAAGGMPVEAAQAPAGGGMPVEAFASPIGAGVPPGMGGAPGMPPFPSGAGMPPWPAPGVVPGSLKGAAAPGPFLGPGQSAGHAWARTAVPNTLR